MILVDIHTIWLQTMGPLPILHHKHHEKKYFGKKIKNRTSETASRNKKSVYDLPEPTFLGNVWIFVSYTVSKSYSGKICFD